MVVLFCDSTRHHAPPMHGAIVSAHHETCISYRPGICPIYGGLVQLAAATMLPVPSAGGASGAAAARATCAAIGSRTRLANMPIRARRGGARARVITRVSEPSKSTVHRHVEPAEDEQHELEHEVAIAMCTVRAGKVDATNKASLCLVMNSATIPYVATALLMLVLQAPCC